MDNTLEQTQSVNEKKFHHLIETICRAAGIKDCASMRENIVFRVGGVLFCLMHQNLLDPEHMSIVADFGLPPSRGEPDNALRCLQEAGAGAYDDEEDPASWINPDNGHVMLMKRLPLTGISPQATLDLMASLADLGKMWRASLFLENTIMAGCRSRMVH